MAVPPGRPMKVISLTKTIYYYYNQPGPAEPQQGLNRRRIYAFCCNDMTIGRNGSIHATGNVLLSLPVTQATNMHCKVQSCCPVRPRERQQRLA